MFLYACCCATTHTILSKRSQKPNPVSPPHHPTHHSSLSACQGALLLVDSTQGIQAQTLSTHARATEQGLAIIPVVTKADLPHAQTDEVTLQMAATLEVRFACVCGCVGVGVCGCGCCSVFCFVLFCFVFVCGGGLVILCFVCVCVCVCVSDSQTFSGNVYVCVLSWRGAIECVGG
jgi:hypothetical protein